MVTIPFLLDSISAGVGFIFYLVACLVKSLKDDSKVGRSESRRLRDNPKGRDNKPRSKINTLQLLGTLLLLALSLAHAILLAKSREDRLELKADRDVASILFGSLIWLVVLLSLLEASTSATYELFVPWMMGVVPYTISSAFSTAQSHHVMTADVIVQWSRVLTLLALILSVVLARRKRIVLGDTDGPAAEETQPLISPEDDNDSKAKNIDDWDDDDDKSIASNFSDEEDNKKKEELTDAQKEEQTQRLALRDRPWYQYVASFRVFIPFVQPRTGIQWFYLSCMVLNTAAARAIRLGQPLMLGAVIDDLTERQFKLWKILAYVGLRFASSASGISLIKNIVSFRLNIELHNALLTYCYNHIMDLDATFHMSKSTPSTWQIMDRGQSVINLLQDVVFDHLPVVADLIIALFVVSHLFGAYLCFAVAVTMLLLSWSNRITMSRKTRMRRYYVDLWRNWYNHMNESFMHWRTVSEFNKIGYEKERHTTKTKAFTKVQIRQRSFSIYLNAVQEIVVTLGFLFVCIMAALEISSGRLDVGRFVVLITYWGQIMSPVTRLASIASDIAEQLVDAEKLMLLLEKKPKITNKPNAPKFVFQGGKVEVENCNFSYDNERTVTKGVSFSANPGETIALVGETGGGKSTIFNLLYRFYDPTEGRVLVDGQDISKVNLQSYRAELGLVPQDPVLFNTSILKNIRYSNPSATKQEVIEASRAAQFHDKVEKFPKKYLQKVGELAQKLSGGERQRLAIARAIIKKPGILLLDEATSSVDSVTEAKIQGALDELAAGRTTFIIAHRLSTILNADKILVIKNGEIVESGSHQWLLDHGNGSYKQLWEAQLKLNQGREKKGKKQTGDETADGKTDLITFDHDSDTDPDKKHDSDKDHEDNTADKSTITETDDDDGGKAARIQAAEFCEPTPPMTRDPTPRTGSVDGEAGEAQTTQEDTPNTVQEVDSSNSDASSVKSSKSRSYGTV